MQSSDKQKKGDAQAPLQQTTKVTGANAQGSSKADGTVGAKSAIEAAQLGEGTTKMAIEKVAVDKKDEARRQKSLETGGKYPEHHREEWVVWAPWKQLSPKSRRLCSREEKAARMTEEITSAAQKMDTVVASTGGSDPRETQRGGGGRRGGHSQQN
eukprot:1703199-Rhodomonas_salina.3